MKTSAIVLIRSVVTGGMLVAGLSTSSAAQLTADGFRARVWAGPVGRYVLKDNDPFVEPGFGTVGLQVTGSGPGFGTDVEYKPMRWIGVDAAVGYANLPVQFTSGSGAKSTQRLNVI